MGTIVLACPGVRANGVTAGILGAGLTPPPPFVTVTPPPSLGPMMVEVDE